MDSHALEKLEYFTLLETLAGYADSDSGSDWIRRLKPLSDKEKIRVRQRLFDDAGRVLRRDAQPPHMNFKSLDTILQRVRPQGAVLNGIDLRQCGDFLQCVSRIKKFLHSEECDDCSALIKLREKIDTCSQLKQALDDAVDEEGEILDSASPELRSLRRQVKRLENEIYDVLQKELNSEAGQSLFQDKFITIRNGRYVVPVARHKRNQVKGIVHDHSNSGQTLFMELNKTLELGNNLADSRLEEQDECRRIRKELSEMVRERIDDFIINQDCMKQLDAAFAVGRWGCDHDCVMPAFSNRFSMFRARHPLLEQQLMQAGRGREIVPLDVDIDPEIRAMAVTGSNSGGKTVAVKTAGLLSAAAQAGFPIPVDERTELPFFNHIYADIGDEQSLSENLSTFTGHVKRIKDILDALNSKEGRSFVILDELGTGTDPLEGGALACAVLDELRCKAELTFVTTHLGAIKNFVHNQQDMVNASVRFNPETLTPEYKLDIGQPGSSHALAIAEQLGVDSGVLNRAKQFMGSEHVQLEDLLSSLQQQEREAESRERETEQARESAMTRKKEAEEEAHKLYREREKFLNEAYREAQQIVDETRQRMEQLLKNFSSTGSTEVGVREQAKEARREINRQSEELSGKVWETHPQPRQPLDSEAIEKGDIVWVEKLQANAEVTEVSPGSKQVQVSLDGLEFRVDKGELGHPQAESAETKSKSKGKSSGQVKGGKSEKKSSVTLNKPRVQGKAETEVNLIGCYVEDARTRLEKAINKAVLAGLPELRVVHGFGTGRLKEAVHQYLSSCPLVTDYRLGQPDHDAGGGGVTIVTLEN